MADTKISAMTDGGTLLTTDSIPVVRGGANFRVVDPYNGTVTSVALSVPAFLSIAGSPITTNGTLAITLSGVALPVLNGGTGITSFGAGVATWLGAPSSANLLAAQTDKTGTGLLVFGTAPSIAGGTHTAITSLGIRSTGAAFDLTIATSEVLTAGRTLSIVMGDAARTLTLSGNPSLSGVTITGTGTLATTAGQTYTFPAATDTVAGLLATQTFTGVNTFSPVARSSGVLSYFTITTPADTGITAATEAIGVNFVTATRTWATTGTVANQREVLFAGKTYASAGASQTFTDISTVAITPPIVGTNAVFTRAHSLQIVDATSAASSITGGLIVVTTLGTTATAVGIGGGNVNLGGILTAGSSTVLNSVAGSTALTVTPGAQTSGIAGYVTINTPTDTGLTAATESIGFKTVTGTRTWATTGTVALQREIFFAGPTYASAGASQTFTDAFTLYATPPVVGTNAVFTRGHTLGIVDSTSAASSITGGFIVATTLGTAATSVGIGGGNINCGGTLIVGGATTHTGSVLFSGGITASSATALNFSGSTGTFSTSTGAVTIGTGTISMTGAVTISATNATTALTITQTARTSGILPYVKINTPADTAQTAATESPGILTVTATRTWATTGTVALQREIFFAGPTYASASPSQTFTEAFTLYVTPPVQGSNAIFTRAHTLGIVDATSSATAITGGVVIATTLGTAATSVGIGGGNVTAGGNIFASTSTGRIGFLTGSGAGGAVTQATSRATGVTLNTPTGGITLVSAAGSTTPFTFVVTCSSVAAVDTVLVNQQSGTDVYEIFITNVAAGSFKITAFTTGGTTTEQPVFNYTVVKGAAT